MAAVMHLQASRGDDFQRRDYSNGSLSAPLATSRGSKGNQKQEDKIKMIFFII